MNELATRLAEEIKAALDGASPGERVGFWTDLFGGVTLSEEDREAIRGQLDKEPGGSNPALDAAEATVAGEPASESLKFLVRGCTAGEPLAGVIEERRRALQRASVNSGGSAANLVNGLK